MSATQKLLDAIVSGTEDQALAVALADPEAARGYGEAGQSPVLAAVYRRMDRLAAALRRTRQLDLHEAAAVGDSARLVEVARTTQSLDTFEPDGWTPLHLAAFFGHAEAAGVLLDAGAAIDAVSRNATANTPLCAALAGAGSREVIELLMDGGANVNARAAHALTPLHLAASRGADALVELLLAHGADPSAEMDGGARPADLARARGHAGTAALLEARQSV